MTCPWLLESVCRSAVDAWEWVFNPLWVWYFYFAAFLFVSALVMWFLGWLKPVRWVVGTAVVLAAAYLAGGRHMYGKMKSKVDEERERARQKQQEAPPWKWPWEQS